MHSRGAFVDTCGNKRKINQIDIFSKFWSLCFVCSVQRQRAYAKHQAYVIGNGRLKMSVWSSKNYSMLNRQFAPLSLYLHIYLYNIQTSEPHTHTQLCRLMIVDNSQCLFMPVCSETICCVRSYKYKYIWWGKKTTFTSPTKWSEHF